MKWIVEHIREISKAKSLLLNIFEIEAETVEDAKELGRAPIDGIKVVVYASEWKEGG